MTSTRLLTVDDAPVLAELLRANRDFLTPWQPTRSDEFYTVAGQRAEIERVLESHERGSVLPHVIVDGSGRAVGRITLSSVIRGAFQSCSVGYWVSAADNGRGIATAAVREIVKIAFGDLGLHRVQAETLPENVGSQRVLERTGFVRYGLAPDYLKINGRWREHVLYQRVRTDPEP